MYASTLQSGTCTGSGDTCKTPTPPSGATAPVTYVNVASCFMAQDSAASVYFSGCAALTEKSNMTTSNGDEAGTAGGVVSSKIMGKVEYTLGSFTVKVNGASAVYMNSATTQNDNNIVGAQLDPSQTTGQIQS